MPFITRVLLLAIAIILTAGQCAQAGLVRPAPPSTPAHSLFKRADEPQVDADGLIYGCSLPNTLAMTFDDGPYMYTPGLLDMLKREGVQATFFVNGDNYGELLQQENANVVRRAYAEGHQIGSHTWSHADLALKTEAEVREEMEKLDDALMQVLGVRPAYMRPPYGSTSPVARAVLKDMGYKAVIWNIETQDTDHPDDVDASMEAYGVMGLRESKAKGWISLQHDPIQSTSEVLAERVIKYAKAQQYRLMTVAQCLGDAAGVYRTV